MACCNSCALNVSHWIWILECLTLIYQFKSISSLTICITLDQLFLHFEKCCILLGLLFFHCFVALVFWWISFLLQSALCCICLMIQRIHRLIDGVKHLLKRLLGIHINFPSFWTIFIRIWAMKFEFEIKSFLTTTTNKVSLICGSLYLIQIIDTIFITLILKFKWSF